MSGASSKHPPAAAAAAVLAARLVVWKHQFLTCSAEFLRHPPREASQTALREEDVGGKVSQALAGAATPIMAPNRRS